MRFYDSLFDISTPVLFMLCIIAALLLAGTATLLMRGMQRLFPSKPGAALVTTTLSGLITPAALTIVFLSNEVWNEAGKAQAAVDKEGIAVMESMRLARHLPEEAEASMKAAILAYGRAVVDADWPAMAERGASARADDALFAWRSLLYEDERSLPSSSRPALDALKQHVQAIAEAKEMRRVIARHHVSDIKWMIMITLLFACSCALAELHRNHVRELVTVVMLFSLAFGSIGFLILMHDRPFAGVTTIRPDSIERLLHASGTAAPAREIAPGVDRNRHPPYNRG